MKITPILLTAILTTCTAATTCLTNDQCETPDTGLACQSLNNISSCLYCNATNSQDEVCGSAFVCSIDQTTLRYKCTRAPLFGAKTSWAVWLGAVFLFLGSALAAGGGLGGGGIFVPVLILVLSLSPKEAVPISQAMIFGGSLVNLVMNYRSRHPVVKTRPLIDYDAVLILEPLMLLGTTFGVMLNAVQDY